MTQHEIYAQLMTDVHAFELIPTIYPDAGGCELIAFAWDTERHGVCMIGMDGVTVAMFDSAHDRDVAFITGDFSQGVELTLYATDFDSDAEYVDAIVTVCKGFAFDPTDDDTYTANPFPLWSEMSDAHALILTMTDEDVDTITDEIANRFGSAIAVAVWLCYSITADMLGVQR